MNNVNNSISSDYNSLYNVCRREIGLIFSDSGAMLILVFAILIYTTIYSIAYGGEVVENIPIAIVDEDNTSTSRSYINSLRSGPNTILYCEPISMSEAQEMFYNREAFGIVYIPSYFEQQILSMVPANISLILDGSHLLLYKQVLEQAITTALIDGAEIDVEFLVSKGEDDITSLSIVQPVSYNSHILYNTSLGYGSFVMPSIVIVIIQQTMLIGVAMVAIRRRKEIVAQRELTYLESARVVLARTLTYILLYAINLVIILVFVWQIFGFPYNGSTIDIAILLFIYMVCVSALAQSLSHLFVRRESVMMLLLWSSVPILLLAGVSYPNEAFPAWLYDVGRIIPSSSAVDAFIRVCSMGASLYNVRNEVMVLITLAVLYTSISILLEKYYSINRK